jgi:hypothetical protein
MEEIHSQSLSKFEKLIIKVFQFFESNNLNSPTDFNIKLASKALNCTEKEVLLALKACIETKTEFLEYKSTNDDEELVSEELDEHTYKSYYFNMLDRINTTNNKTYIMLFDVEFKRYKDKTKVYISKIFTVNLIKDKIKRVAKKYNLTEQKAVMLHKKEIDAEEMLVFKLAIIDKGIVEEFISNSRLPSQKEIALKIGIAESALTQGYKRFLNNVYNKINEYKSIN